MRYPDWDILKDYIEDNKSIIEIGSGDGDLAKAFIEKRSGTILCVKNDNHKIDELNMLVSDRLKVVQSVEGIEETFDYGFYFGLHYVEGVDFLPWLSKHCKVLFTHSARVRGDLEFNEKYRLYLKEFFKSVMYIGEEQIGKRAVFKCC